MRPLTANPNCAKLEETKGVLACFSIRGQKTATAKQATVRARVNPTAVKRV